FKLDCIYCKVGPEIADPDLQIRCVTLVAGVWINCHKHHGIEARIVVSMRLCVSRCCRQWSHIGAFAEVPDVFRCIPHEISEYNFERKTSCSIANYSIDL